MKNNSTQNTAPTSDQVSGRLITMFYLSKCQLSNHNEKLFIPFSIALSCSVTWNIFGGVADMGMEREPGYMYKMQCSVPFNKHFQTAPTAQR